MAANPSLGTPIHRPAPPDGPDSPYTPPSADAGGGTDGGSTFDQTEHDVYTKHGILMGVAWCILLPLGLLMIKIKNYPPIAKRPTLAKLFFYLHMFFNVAAMAVATAGFAYPFSQGFLDYQDVSLSHGTFGVAVMALMWFQVLMPWLRPAPTPLTMVRRVWEFAHVGLGRSIMLLALVQIAIGIYVISDPEFGGNVQMFIYLCAIPVAIVFLTAQVFDRLRQQHDVSRREQDKLPIAVTTNSHPIAITSTSAMQEPAPAAFRAPNAY